MSQSWKNIWSNRPVPEHGSTLEKLLMLNGMDTGFGSVSEQGWLTYVNGIINKCQLTKESTVFEVGCGSGAFLFPLYEQGIPVAGLDFSEKLLQTARQIMPLAQFNCAEASETINGRYSHVFSSGVFMYFPNLEYAATVITNMADAADQQLVILDLPDINKKKPSETARRQLYSKGDYQKDYQGLSHQYYEKNWIRAELQKSGFNSVEIVEQHIEGYQNSAYRLNVFAHRHHK